MWSRLTTKLLYQTHEYRAEHWAVVAGKATRVIDSETVILGPGESVDIAIGQPHRITNADDGTLTIIEVQLGSYLGEDDIVRLEDDYGRG